MIAQIWRGILRANASEDYLRFLRERVIPAYEAAGSQSIHILLDQKGEFVTILLLSFWESRAALEAFHEPQGANEFLLASEAAAVYEVV
jgi:heme-degrading monooxygenase HmoA